MSSELVRRLREMAKAMRRYEPDPTPADLTMEAADRIERLEMALREAQLALETPARRVFNDNGDHAIDTSPLDPDVYSACYYAARTVFAALQQKEKG